MIKNGAAHQVGKISTDIDEKLNDGKRLVAADDCHQRMQVNVNRSQLKSEQQQH